MNATTQLLNDAGVLGRAGSRTFFRLSPTRVVILYALAMGWVESAVVFYMRSMIDRLVPYQANPLPISGGFGFAEVVREAATMVMLLMVGWLAGKTWRS